MQDVRPDVWSAELEEVLVRVGHRFGRMDLRRQMRAYIHGLLGPVGRKNSPRRGQPPGSWPNTQATAPLRVCRIC
ncbi:InsA [Streptomyces viridosporus ATCC 14672]|uniref:InsA n=1 Tax=Streptomyces viridosporus (strain ATCC 14672 / DSM 40746 / JCM 4963 / KCTC 9882 / NRRL B-12104 / FH 1290) TaxID=566461 RepID=D6A9W7_STRV1|nr:InsA [Streptomyces viridosporus ATCC 14672]